MYSIIPGLVSFLFLFFGLYVVSQKGISRVSISFLILCITTFFWQFTWAALFQASDDSTAIALIKIGWMLILFLPTSLYHFICETTDYRSDLKYVVGSYVLALSLAAFLIASNLVISGYYEFFWGYYPKAGKLHIVHVLQTIAVVSRGLYITYVRLREKHAEERARLSLCFFALLVYCLAAVDYLCNYGMEFYPPGVLFITVSLGIIVVATTRFNLMDNARAIAASVVHELRTPLATVNLQAQVLTNYLPILAEAYRKAVKHKLVDDQIDEDLLEAIAESGDQISEEVKHTNQAIDLVLAAAPKFDNIKRGIDTFSVSTCVRNAVNRYPLVEIERHKIKIDEQADFKLKGSDTFLTFVVFNLLKNAIYAIQQKGQGEITVQITQGRIDVSDTGIGIDSSVLPNIFSDFYTTKSDRSNAGLGLAFCRRVTESFGGEIQCESVVGKGSRFSLIFHKERKKRR